MKRRHTGLTVLVILEIAALVIIIVLGILEKLKPEKDTRTIQTTESITEAVVQIATPEDAEVVTEVTTEAATEEEVQEPELSQTVKNQLADMTLEEKVALLFVVSPETLTDEVRVTIAGEKTRNYLSQYHVGGLTYSYADNYEEEEQLKDLLDNTQIISAELMPYVPLMFARDDEEGKLISTTNRNLNALSKTLTTEDGVKESKQNASISVISRYPGEAVSEEAGIVLFEPVENENGTLVCLSEADIQVYRKENGYYGIIMAGRMDDEAVTGAYSSAEVAVAAVKAGADMIYEPDNFEEAYTAVVQAVGDGELSEEAIDKAAGRVLTYMEQIGYLSENATGEGNEE